MQRPLKIAKIAWQYTAVRGKSNPERPKQSGHNKPLRPKQA